MLKLNRLAAAFYGCLVAITISSVAIADNHEGSTHVASSSLAMGAQQPEKITEPLEVKFSRSFGVPADGSWDGLFSGDNVLDPVKYANEKPEQTIFKSGQ